MTSAPTTLTIALSAETIGYLEEVVASAAYGSQAEAIDDAIREWRDRRRPGEYTVGELRALAQEGHQSGLSTRASMADVKAEARYRLKSAGRG